MINGKRNANRALSDEQRSLIVSFLSGLDEGIHSDPYLKARRQEALSDPYIRRRVHEIFFNEHRSDPGDERFVEAVNASIGKAIAEYLIEQAMPNIQELVTLSDEGLKERLFKALELTPECRGALLDLQDFFQPILKIADLRGTTIEEVVKSKRN